MSQDGRIAGIGDWEAGTGYEESERPRGRERSDCHEDAGGVRVAAFFPTFFRREVPAGRPQAARGHPTKKKVGA
jgi:hypothetical protein